MAYILSHLELGRRVNARLDRSRNWDEGLFLLGCLGPDVFFYDRLPPPLFRRNEKKLGNAFHNMDAASFLTAAGASPRPTAHSSLRREQAPALLLTAHCPLPTAHSSYICGLLCHFALDAWVHPYIESRATGPAHSRFEALIDSRLLPGFSERDDPFAGLPPVSAAGPVDALWTDWSAALCGKKVAGVFTRSYRNFLTVAKLLFDPHGRKSAFARCLEWPFGGKGKLSGFLVWPGRADEDDCLNMGRKPWAPPWARERVSASSFEDLFDGAAEEAVSLIGRYLDGDTIANALAGRSMQRGAL
ncbi:MAG: zinc dependent phospholipase C family protein [Clostridiales bacterium]|nr:zinc dependent phospholipase C family protein [Clostridiales bacterium]